MKKDNLVSMIYLVSSPKDLKKFNESLYLIKTEEKYKENIKMKLLNKEEICPYDKAAFQTFEFLVKLWNENGRY